MEVWRAQETDTLKTKQRRLFASKLRKVIAGVPVANALLVNDNITSGFDIEEVFAGHALFSKWSV